jgi:hypothetical protein
MNQDANNGSTPGARDIQDAQQPGRSTTYKRSNRQGRNRPVLVTPTDGEQPTAIERQSDIDEALAATSTTTTDTPEKKGRPKFFSTIGRKEAASETTTADPNAARLARAIRGKTASTTKTGEKKQEVSSPARASSPAKSSAARTAMPPRRGGFKPRHLIGILLYLIVADVAGLYEKQLLVNGHLEKLLFTLGPVQVYLSTVMFLLTLIVLLIVLARFDLVPRSLMPTSTQTRPTSKGQAQTPSNRAETNAQTSMKQGVKGADDDLYQEYRQNQRYWQRKDRKK